MVRVATGVEAITCETTLQADVIELRLIAAHAPRYNRRSKFPERLQWLKITEEAFPRLSMVRDGPRRRRRPTSDRSGDDSPPRTSCWRSTTASRSGSARPAEPDRPTDGLRPGRDGPVLRPCDGSVGPRGVRRGGRAGARRPRRRRPAGRAGGVAAAAPAGRRAALRGGGHHPAPAGDADPTGAPLPPGPQPGRVPGDRRRPARGRPWEIHVDPVRPPGRRRRRLARARSRRRWPGRRWRPPRPWPRRSVRCRPPGSRRPSRSPTGSSSPASG